MRTRLLPLVALTAAALALTGCGTTQPAASEEESGPTLTVTDARGVEVELDGPAERVVTTEWNVTEHAVALGVMPVGVADVEGYGNWVAAEPLDEGVEDIGTRGEPSIDAVAALAPDLVVATTDLPEAAVAQLEEIAPVLVIRSADASQQIERMTGNLELIAQATGTEDRAADLIAGFESTLEEGRAALADAGLEGTPIAFADAYAASGQVSIRPFVDGSLVGSVNAELGLADAWELEGDADYGLAATDVEGLTAVGDATFVYYANDAAAGDPVVENLTGNAVWESLPFVQQDRVIRLPDGIWMFGGTSSMALYVDALVSALTT